MVDSVEVLLNFLGVKPSGLSPFSALPPLWCFNNNNNNNCIIYSLVILKIINMFIAIFKVFQKLAIYKFYKQN